MQSHAHEMGTRRWQIGVCGTFDVANYGDLLFPLIAESELIERLGALDFHRFSYGARTVHDWPFDVTSVTALPQKIRCLDGLLIGGGFLIRFDKHVAPGYAPPTPDIHHPTGYWLSPALLALQHDVRLMWNAPGLDGNEIPEWAAPLMEEVLSLSEYVSVRDEQSAAALARFSARHIPVVPDTAFGIRRLLDRHEGSSAAFARLRSSSGLDGPYIVVQATSGLERFVQFVKRHARAFSGFRFLALPIGPVLGDDAAMIDADLPGLVRLSSWPAPVLIAELIANAEAVVGHSYHLFVTALASGVPIFTGQNLGTGKYIALRHFDTIFQLPAEGEPDLSWFLANLGRTRPHRLAQATCAPLREHWDRIAAGLQMDKPSTSSRINAFWQSLPTLLEDTAVALATARAMLDARERRIADMTASTSWRVTAPVRMIGRLVARGRRSA